MEIQGTTPRVQTGPLSGSLRPPAATTPELPAAGPKVERDTRELSNTGKLRGYDMPDLGPVSGDPQAAADLQRLSEQGKLTPDVMAGLQKLTNQPLAEGVDRADLMRTALHNLADPTSISQGDRNTCAAAVVQVTLARQDPAEYLRLTSGLASPEGKVTMQNGETLQRDSEWNGGNGRSVVDNLMQSAFTDYAVGSEAAAKARGDVGMYADEQDKLQTAVTGKATQSVFNDDPSQFPQLQAQMEAALQEAKPVSAILNLKDASGNVVAGHAVTVDKIEHGRVYLTDPKNGPRSMSLAEFQAQTQSVALPKEKTTNLPKPATRQNRGVLAGCGNPLKAIGNAFKKVTGFLGKIMPFASTIMSFIPGLNIAGWAMKAFDIAKSLREGNFLGAIGSAVGGKVGEMVSKVSDYVNKAKDVISGFKNGGVFGALGAAGGAIGGDAGKLLAQGSALASAVKSGDIGGALGALGGSGLVGDSKAFSQLQGAYGAFEAARKGDVMGALGGLQSAGLVGDSKTLDTLKGAYGAFEAARSGDVVGALGGLQSSGLVGDNKTLSQLSGAFGAVEAARKGDVQGALSQLQASGMATGSSTVDQLKQSFGAVDAARKGDVMGALDALQASGLVKESMGVDRVRDAYAVASAAGKGNIPQALDALQRTGLVQDTDTLQQLRRGYDMGAAIQRGDVEALKALQERQPVAA